MPEVRIGPVEHAEIGNVLHTRSHIRLSAIFPNLPQRAAVLPFQLNGMHKVDRLEARRADQEIEVVLDILHAAVVIFDLDVLTGDAIDRPGLERHVR